MTVTLQAQTQAGQVHISGKLDIESSSRTDVTTVKIGYCASTQVEA